MEGNLIKNRYRLEQRLGEGAMGVVYRAFDMVEDSVVAIKVAGLSSYHEAAARFQREAQATLSLAHPNIVRVYATDEDGGISFMVMEYLSGQSLREIIPLQVSDALDIAIQVANALQYAHERGIIHRDIKPENLMVMPSFDGSDGLLVKVMDFGLARRLHDQFELSESGMLIGTAAYIAPEQALGNPIDARADLYALGIVLYEMLVGHGPFTGDSFVAVIYRHLNEPPPAPHRFNPAIPSSLEQIILRLLRKDPFERYESAAQLVECLRTVQTEVTAATQVGLIEPPAVERRAMHGGIPLIGRQAEMTSLRESLQQVKAGHGQFALIAGEPGIGKTRLAQEALTYARLLRFQVLSAACYEQEEGFPYQPFIDALKAFAAKVTWQDTTPIRNALQGYAGELTNLIPEMAKICGESSPPIRLLSPEQEKARLFEAVRQAILGLSQISPVVIFLDDLQWADSTSIQLLRYIVRRITDQPILVLATYRTSEVSQQLSDFLTAVAREKQHRPVTLERLSRQQTTALIEALLDQGQASPGLVEKVHAETEGNPFFVEETIEHLIEEKLLEVKEGRWQVAATDEHHISANIREVIQRRLARLTQQVRDLLAVAAVVGRECPFALLKEALADDDLLATLDASIESGLIQELQQRREELYDFNHALIREVTYTGLTAARRRSLHQRVGEILERMNGEDSDEALGELVYHFSRGYEFEKSIKYGYLAGKRAMVVYATQDAFRYFDTARELAEEEGRTAQLVDILDSLGQVAIILGQFDKALESFGKAIEALERQTPKPVERLIKLKGEISSVYERLGRYDDALRELEDGLNIAGDSESVESAYLHGQMAVIHNRLGNLDKAMEYAKRDLALAEKLGDEEEVAQACTILYKLHSLLSDWENARKFTERALEIWKKRNDVYRQEWNYLNLGAALWVLGRWPEAAENWQRALEISRSIRYLQGIIQNSLNLGYLNLCRGKQAEAQSLFTEALSLAGEIGHRFYVARATMRMAELRRQEGYLPETIELFAKAESILRQIGHKPGLTELLWLMADAYADLDKLDIAQDLAEEALSLAPQPDGYEELGSACRVLARVCLKKGDQRRARELVDKSVECLDKLGDIYGQAQVRTDLANLLIADNSPAGLAQASLLLEQALSDFERLQAYPDMARAQSALANLKGMRNDWNQQG